MAKRLPKPGDLLEIHLPDGRYAYAHYVLEDPHGGPLVRVLEGIFAQPLPVERVAQLPHRFWAYVGINPPVREGRWRIIGSKPVEDVELPLLRSLEFGTPKNNHTDGIWFVRRAGEPGPGRRVGGFWSLPPEYLALDYDDLGAGEDLEERILTGKRFPWKERVDALLRERLGRAGESGSTGGE